jgi:phosphoribosylglycinamide formyltransferase 1
MKKPKLAFLASHGGSNMQAIIDAIKKGDLTADPVAVISNNSESQALKRAREEGIDCFHLSGETHPDPHELDQAIVKVLKARQTDLVILAGFMKKIGPAVLTAYQGRILNIHPALLPCFGGRGMYGKRVHEAVLTAGVSYTGVTVHLVDEHYDHGPILAQTKVPVERNDTVDTLAKRVLQCEHRLYTETIARIITGEIALPSPFQPSSTDASTEDKCRRQAAAKSSG